MMNSMIKENDVTFKELEKNIYTWVSQIRREFTKGFLERYDQRLKEDRDKKKCRNKGAKQITITNCVGEVTYQRIAYEVTEEDETRCFVYPLDEILEPDCKEALEQIEAKKYAEAKYRGMKKVIKHGIVFCEKECMVMMAPK